jgi:4-hydroxy 2-oxovalerate aldolase
MNKQNITILDCTLRDGGFYTNWDFDPELVQKTLHALVESRVDIVELGYKSTQSTGFYGLFKYCNEDLIKSIVPNHGDTQFAFMIDAKEFIQNGQVDDASLDRILEKSDHSVFSWARVATTFPLLETAKLIAEKLKALGYKIAVNIMGVSLLSEPELQEAITIADQYPAEVIYIADSFGSFYPEDVSRLLNISKKHTTKPLGIHTHDNQGMAYANTLKAIEEGVTFIDATITGMGRGAGNLMLEQLLLGIKKVTDHPYKPAALYDLIQLHYDPMKIKYKWGFHHSYMFSGMHNIHQSYCQSLNKGNRYTHAEINEILENIDSRYRVRFNEEKLKEAVEKAIKTNEQGTTLPLFSDPIPEEVIILANGPSLKRHKDAIKAFILKKKLVVLECNPTALDITKNLTFALNKVKLQEILDQQIFDHTIVTGQETIPLSEASVFKQMPFVLGSTSLDKAELRIPDYDVGMFTIMTCLKKGVKKIYLAGFDGGHDPEQSVKMMRFFEDLNHISSGNFYIESITPTAYSEWVEETSVYAYLT